MSRCVRYETNRPYVGLTEDIFRGCVSTANLAKFLSWFHFLLYCYFRCFYCFTVVVYQTRWQLLSFVKCVRARTSLKIWPVQRHVDEVWPIWLIDTVWASVGNFLSVSVFRLMGIYCRQAKNDDIPGYQTIRGEATSRSVKSRPVWRYSLKCDRKLRHRLQIIMTIIIIINK